MGVGHPGAALGEDGVDFGVVAGVLDDMFALAEGEDRIFQGTGAVEAPALLGDGLGEIALFLDARSLDIHRTIMYDTSTYGHE
jgi:hypothetical protein